MNKRLLYLILICIILWWVIFLWKFTNNTHESRFGYTVNLEYEIIDITPVHTWYNIKVENQKWPQFNNEEDCKARAGEPTKNEDKIKRVCYNIDPEDWVWFYMWDSEPRPVFKTYEECEDRAISMMPYSLVENAEWWVHAWDWDTRCSQWCHYGYVYMNRMTWVNLCNKTIHSVIWWADKFEKIMDKLDEWWNYDRFKDAFWNDVIECDIKIKNNNETIYSYFVWLWHEINSSRHDVVAHLKDKIITRQKNQKDWKIFYVQQMEWLVYVRWDIYDKSIWKIYKIEGWNDNIIFSNIKQLFENENSEISCNNDFGWYSSNDQREFYTLPQNIEWIDAWNIDNIYYRLYD